MKMNKEDKIKLEEMRYRKQISISHSFLGKDYNEKYDTGKVKK